MKKNKFITFCSFFIVALAFVMLCFTSVYVNKGITPRAEETTYEEPDRISVCDLMKNGSSVGNKLILGAHGSYTYNKTAKYGSVVFTFTYKNNDWNVDDDGFQLHLNNTWQMNGMFWLRPDHVRIAYKDAADKQKYVVGDPISAGSHEVELGRLAIMEGDTYSGNQYFFLKIDGTLYCEYVHNQDVSLLNSNGIFMTGTNSNNYMLDSNWTGSRITFMANGEVFHQETTTNDYISCPANEPVATGKTFVGWFDKMGKEWDFAKNQVYDNLVLRAGFKDDGEDMSDEEYFNDNTYTPVLRFMLASDVHIGTSPSVRDTNLANAIDYANTFANSSNKYKSLDAALFAGDISDNGDQIALNSFKTTALAHLNNDTQFVVSMGNHDFRGASAADSIAQFANLFGPVDKHLIINGFHFISLSPDLSQGEHFSQDKVVWLDNQLALAAEADSTKPIFVMQHEHIQGTVYGSDAWYVSELTNVMCKYPQVVDMSGHSHYPLADPRSIWQGTFTALGTGTLHYYELGINGYKNTGIYPKDHNGGWGTSPSPGSSAAEFQIIEIDANNAIRVIAYDLVGKTEICRYYMRNVMDDVKFKYSHTERAKDSQAPVFDNNNSLELSSVKATITLKFNQAKCDDVVESYKALIYKDEELVKTEYILSDYFYNPTPETIEYTITGLKSDTLYNVKLYAVNVWGDESEVPLTGNIKTEVVNYEPERYAPYDLINVLDIDYPDNTGILENIPSEGKVYNYPGTASNYTAVYQFYLITGNLTEKDEFRTQVGTNWKYYITFWIQTGKYDKVFCGWIYSTSGSDRIDFNIQSNHIYKVEYGTVMVEAGEHEGEGYVYLKIDDNLLKGFYIPAKEFKSENYNVSMHISDNYKIADINLARNIEYYVDNNKVSETFGISGLKTTEPETPVKDGLFFVGWFTDPVGGEMIDFSKPIVSDDPTIKLYARYTDTTFKVNIHDEYGGLIETKVAGKDCKIFEPEAPSKYGQYRYTFLYWKDMETNEPFDFETRITKDVNLMPVFTEYEYRIVYLVDGLEYVTKYYVESNPSVIMGEEPTVPELLGATGYWDYSTTRNNKDIYATARYDGKAMTSSNDITLDKFNGATVDIADDLTRFYLSFANTEEQAAWIDSYPVSGGHERQNLTFSWQDSTRNMAYLVYFADNEDFNDAFIVKTDKKSIDYVGIFIPGKTYYWKVVGITNENVSAVDTFTVLNTPVRWISAGTVFNVRDIGGWATTDGKVVNYGNIYRGGQLSIDQPSELSYMNDYSFKVFSYLGIKTEIELRGDKPHDYNQFNELEKLVFISADNYMGIFNLKDKAKEQYRAAFAALANPDNYPFYFHCSWGADRTGTLGFLINAVLGVPFEQLVEDYELTSLSNSGTRTRYGWSNGAFMNMYNTFMNNYARGGTLQDAVTNYLKEEIGVTQTQINSLKQIMLSDNDYQLQTHTVTYMVDGEVYQTSLVFDGELIKGVVPVYFDRCLDCWLLNGEPFDDNTKVTKDLVLEARFKDIIYEDYDIVTIRDLGVGETFVPTAGTRSYEGTSSTGGRLFVFDYKIEALDGTFDDGVHVEAGLNTWDCRAHIWFCNQTSIHIFIEGIGADGTMHPAATYNRHLEYGKTYRISVGVLIPINGPYAGKKMFIVLIDDELLSIVPTIADISSNYNIGLAGTEGLLSSVANKKTVTFVSGSGMTIETKEITRGELVSSIEAEEQEGKVFLGWFDELGNLWNFETNKVLKDMKLFAKYGDRTIDAVVIDANGIEIQHGYKVRIGIQVSEIELPLVSSDKLEFEGWYNGNTLLNQTDIITEDMNLICKFKVIESVTPVEPVEPENPEEPTEPEKPKKGCKSSLSGGLSLIGLALLGFLFALKKKRDERC